MSLLTSLLGSVANDKLADTIASATGMSSEQAKKAVSMAMPLLVSGLAKNASTTDGAQSLSDALDQHDGSILDNLNISDLLNSDDGSKIVNHILGSKISTATESIAQQTDTNPSQIGTIWKIAGPLVMGALSKQKSTQGLDLSGLSSLLSNEKKQVSSDSGVRGVVKDLIDQNDDGSIVDDVIGFASKMMKSK